VTYHLACNNCGEVFISPEDKRDKCPECELHSQLFDDILNDVATEVLNAPVYGFPAVRHLTPEEAGIKAIQTWRDSYVEMLQVMGVEDINHIRDLESLIIRMGWKRTRIHPWHAIMIVTHIYLRDPKICEHGREFRNPFKLLKGSHPGILEFIKQSGKTFPELVAEAEQFLKEEGEA